MFHRVDLLHEGQGIADGLLTEMMRLHPSETPQTAVDPIKRGHADGGDEEHGDQGLQ